jgi:hypothetical protein
MIDFIRDAVMPAADKAKRPFGFCEIRFDNLRGSAVILGTVLGGVGHRQASQHRSSS